MRRATAPSSTKPRRGRRRRARRSSSTWALRAGSRFLQVFYRPAAWLSAPRKPPFEREKRGGWNMKKFLIAAIAAGALAVAATASAALEPGVYDPGSTG